MQVPLPKLLVAISPFLLSENTPEITWTLNSLLHTAGYPWKRVAPDEKADFSYLLPGEKIPAGCKMAVLANPELWKQKNLLKLEGVSRSGNLPHLRYDKQVFIPHTPENTDSCLTISHDVLFDFFWLSAGYAENSWTRNIHGHLEVPEFLRDRDQLFISPPSSAIATWIEKMLSDRAFPPPVPRWPLGKKRAFAVTHDVDYPEIQRFLEPVRLLKKQGWSALGRVPSILNGRRHHFHFDSWIKEESSRGIRSAFYFVPRKGSLPEYLTGTPDPFYDIQNKRYTSVFKKLLDSGFEIGLHASYRSCENEVQFNTEKKALETASHTVIEGGRHHYWRLDPSNPDKTITLHERAGLSYDCSLAHDRYLGWRRGLNHPYYPYLSEEKRAATVLQLPTGWMDDQLFGFSKYNPGKRRNLLCHLMDQVQASGGLLLVDIHDYVFDSYLHPDWAQTFFWLMDEIGKDSKYWKATPKEIQRHWHTREEILQHA